MISGIIDWPDMEVIPDSFYGDVPRRCIFFPELALSEMRGHKAYQFPERRGDVAVGRRIGRGEGRIPHDGGNRDGHPVAGLPDRDQRGLLRGHGRPPAAAHGRRRAAAEFYPSVKRSTIYSMGLRPEDGDDGIISAATGQCRPVQPASRRRAMLEWFEAVKLYGMVTHVGGIDLAQLAMAERMAKRLGDEAFARQCRAWIEAASRSLEGSSGTAGPYLLYSEPKTGRRSDLVFGYQLDGDWMTKYHGLPGVFRPDRARTVLETIRRVNAAITPYGAADLAALDGRESEGVGYGAVTFFVSEMSILVSTYLYDGQREFGLELARRCRSP